MHKQKKRVLKDRGPWNLILSLERPKRYGIMKSVNDEVAD
jgi:hypothetical protein